MNAIRKRWVAIPFRPVPEALAAERLFPSPKLGFRVRV